MSKQRFKSQIRTRSRIDNNNPFETNTYKTPTNEQLYSFAAIYLESRMTMKLTELQKTILRKSFTDPEVIQMWRLRHLQFAEAVSKV